MFCTACTPSPEQDDNTITVLLPRDAEQLDPRFVADPYGLKVSRLVFASLVTIDPSTLQPVPDLAESLEIETPTAYLVTLKPNLRFSDGSTLDADDVIATFRGVLDPALKSRYASTFGRIKRMERVDDRTVRFVLSEPHATFLTDLEFPILRHEDSVRRVAVPGGPAPVGAGPYRLAERAPGRIRLLANPRWHGGEVLHPDVVLVTVRDDNVRAMRLRAGAGDIALNAVPPLLVPMFREDARFDVRSKPGISTTYLGFNTESPKVADLRVRRAIAHALDIDTLLEAKHSGLARRTASWIPAGHWASVALEPLPHAPAKAAELLDAAGLVDPDGAGPEPRTRIVLRTTSDRFRLSLSRALAAMLREVSIDVDVRPSEAATLIADLGRGRFDMTLLQVPEVVEPHVLSWFFASDRVPSEDREGANRWRYRNAALDAALERGRATAVLSDRQSAYAEVQRLLARDLPVLPLWQQDLVAVVRKGVVFDVPRDGRFGTLARRIARGSVIP